jgi:tetratricopeptide (TPR) repeat protein
MNEEERNYFSEEDIGDALSRFKRSLVSGSKKYFDVSEFEGIVEQLLEEGDIKASEIAAKQGIQIHPNAVPLHLKYAQVLLNKGKFEDAITHLNFVEQVESTNPDVFLIKGSAWLVLDNEKKAEKAFNKAIETAGNELDDILYHIGMSYVQAGDIPKAIEQFEKAVIANPENEVALYELGFFCDQQGEFEKSINYYNQYLDIDPFNFSTWFNLGITHNKAGNHDKAIEAYEFALVINDNFHQAIFNIANAHANAGKFREAIKKYNEYLKLDPKNDDAYCYIGECYLNLENYTKSEQHYNKAIEINDENDTAWFGVGLIMWIEKKYTECIVFIKKAIEIDDANSEYWLTLAKVYNDFRHEKHAIKALKKAARLEPENSEVWLTWADIYLKSKDLKDAIHVMRTAIKKNEDAILKYRLVSLLLENKNEPEAFEMLSSAMRQDFLHISYLFDFYPKAPKNKRLKQMVDDFRKTNNI